MHIRPYRTLENMIEGAVINFVEITQMVLAQEELRHLATVMRDAHDAITVQDMAGRILAWNPGAEQMYGRSEAEDLCHCDNRKNERNQQYTTEATRRCPT